MSNNNDYHPNGDGTVGLDGPTHHAPSSGTAPVKLRQQRRPVSEANGKRKSRPISTVSMTSVKSYFNMATEVDFKNQTVPYVNLNQSEEEGARIGAQSEDHEVLEFISDDLTTVFELFKRGINLAGDADCLGWKPAPDKPFQWMSYNKLDQRSTDFGAGLVALGLQAHNNTRIAIYSQNRPEFQVASLGCVKHSIVEVPLYDSLGWDATKYIINHTELSLVVCDNNKKVSTLLEHWQDVDIISTIIIMEPASDDNLQLANQLGVNLVQMEAVEKLGKENPCPFHLPLQKDTYIICYTSGTTGTPKGVVISHKNLAVPVSSMIRFLEQYCEIEIGLNDTIISYLPLAHVYQRVLENYALCSGMKVGYFQGDVKKLLDDIKELRPTIFPTVPRLLNRIYDKILAGVNASKVKKMLFNFALKKKTKEIEKGIIRNNSIWDRLVFRKVQAALGGRCRIIITASAPIAGPVLTTLKCMVGCPIVEAYGQTECSGPATCTLVGEPISGHVGPPLACSICKLVDIPEMNYYNKDNKGELCIKGGHVFTEYFRSPEKTQEALDEDGWLHTGDVAEWTENGCLKIIDRKKHIFKLAQGEYIAPEKIEQVMVQSHYIAQIFVHGDSLQSCLVGVVVLDEETITPLAGKLGLSGTLEELCANKVLKDAVLKDVNDIGTKEGLSSLEKLKDIYIHPELFSVENGLLTPTFKTKRADARKEFEPQIVEMYKKLSAPPTGKSS